MIWPGIASSQQVAEEPSVACEFTLLGTIAGVFGGTPYPTISGKTVSVVLPDPIVMTTYMASDADASPPTTAKPFPWVGERVIAFDVVNGGVNGAISVMDLATGLDINVGRLSSGWTLTVGANATRPDVAPSEPSSAIIKIGINGSDGAVRVKIGDTLITSTDYAEMSDAFDGATALTAVVSSTILGTESPGDSASITVLTGAVEIGSDVDFNGSLDWCGNALP